VVIVYVAISPLLSSFLLYERHCRRRRVSHPLPNSRARHFANSSNMDPFLRLGVQGSPQVPDEDEPCDDEAFFIPSGIISSMDEEEDELERLPQHNIFSTWHHASAFAPTPSTYLTGWSPLGWQQQQQQQQPQQPPLAATKSQPSLPSVKQQPQRGERVSASSGAVSSSGLASQHSLPAIQSAPATTAPARKQPNPPLSTRRATVQPTANPLDSAYVGPLLPAAAAP